MTYCCYEILYDFHGMERVGVRIISKTTIKNLPFSNILLQKCDDMYLLYRVGAESYVRQKLINPLQDNERFIWHQK